MYSDDETSSDEEDVVDVLANRFGVEEDDAAEDSPARPLPTPKPTLRASWRACSMGSDRSADETSPGDLGLVDILANGWGVEEERDSAGEPDEPAKRPCGPPPALRKAEYGFALKGDGLTATSLPEAKITPPRRAGVWANEQVLCIVSAVTLRHDATATADPFIIAVPRQPGPHLPLLGLGHRTLFEWTELGLCQVLSSGCLSMAFTEVDDKVVLRSGAASSPCLLEEVSLQPVAKATALTHEAVTTIVRLAIDIHKRRCPRHSLPLPRPPVDPSAPIAPAVKPPAAAPFSGALGYTPWPLHGFYSHRVPPPSIPMPRALIEFDCGSCGNEYAQCPKDATTGRRVARSCGLRPPGVHTAPVCCPRCDLIVAWQPADADSIECQPPPRPRKCKRPPAAPLYLSRWIDAMAAITTTVLSREADAVAVAGGSIDVKPVPGSSPAPVLSVPSGLWVAYGNGNVPYPLLVSVVSREGPRTEVLWLLASCPCGLGHVCLLRYLPPFLHLLLAGTVLAPDGPPRTPLVEPDFKWLFCRSPSGANELLLPATGPAALKGRCLASFKRVVPMADPHYHDAPSVLHQWGGLIPPLAPPR